MVIKELDEMEIFISPQKEAKVYEIIYLISRNQPQRMITFYSSVLTGYLIRIKDP